MTTAGFDVHNTSVLTRAEDEGVDAEKLAAAYRDEIVDTLDAARIRYDVLLDPQSDAYRRGVTTLAADLTEAGRAPMRRWQPFRAKVPVLSMEDYRQELIEIWLRAELPDQARQLVTYHLERRLPDVPIAYPSDWGLAGTGPHEGLRLDAYAEVGLSTAYGVAQSIRPGAIGLEETARRGARSACRGPSTGSNGLLLDVVLAGGVPRLRGAAGGDRRSTRERVLDQ